MTIFRVLELRPKLRHCVIAQQAIGRTADCMLLARLRSVKPGTDLAHLLMIALLLDAQQAAAELTEAAACQQDQAACCLSAVGRQASQQHHLGH